MMKLLVICALLWIPSAYAYVDPGSGAMLLQGLIALIGAVVVFMRKPVETIKRLIAWIRRK